MTDANEDVIFDRRTNFVVRAIFIKGNETQATPEVIREFDQLPGHISELLMQHEGICFSVYGENLIVPVLVKAYGFRGLHELLEQGAIKFRLEDTGVTHITNGPKGLMPLQSMKLTSSTHVDPEQSVREAFARSTRVYETKALKRLEQELAGSYISLPESFAPNAVAFGHEGHKLGRFAFAGLDGSKPLEDLDGTERAELARLANEMQDLSVVTALRMHVIDEFAIAGVIDESIDRLHRARRIEDGLRKIFSIEGVPALSELFVANQLDIEGVPKLRMSKHARKFRHWMRGVTEDRYAGDAAEEYLSALSSDTGMLKSRPAKVLKSLTVSGLSSIAGGGADRARSPAKSHT